MAKCYLIGLGGTGAKCLESFVHMAAAGLAGEDVWIGMVDQDESNGNVERTKNLLKNYGELRISLRSGRNDLGACGLFRSDIGFPAGAEGDRSAATAVWAPASGVRDLADLFNETLMVDQLRDLFHAIYDAEDRQVKLDVGFRGRPYLGATALQSRSLSGSVFWKDLTDSLNQLRTGLEVRIFLVASIFGGTGAAGMPILARKLWDLVKDMEPRDGFKVGGCMMLPYFGFPQVRDDGAHMNASDFLGQTQGALKYYQQLFGSKEFTQTRLFDSLYFVGWDPLIKLDYEEVGNRAQENPSLLPEVYAALAAANFFAAAETGYFYTNRPVSDHLTWNSLPFRPSKNGGEPISLKNALGTLARFAFAYRNAYGPYLKRDRYKLYQDQPWYRGLIAAADVDLDNSTTNDVLEKLEKYCADYLGWLASLCHLPPNEQNNTRLAMVEAFSLKPQKVGRGQTPLLPPADFKRKLFGQLIHDAPGPDLPQVLSAMCRGVWPAEAKGLGRFVGALHDACRVS